MTRRFQSTIVNLVKMLAAAPLMLVAVTCVEHMVQPGGAWLGMRGRIECLLIPVLFGAVNGILLGSWRKGALLFLFATPATVAFFMQAK